VPSSDIGIFDNVIFTAAVIHDVQILRVNFIHL